MSQSISFPASTSPTSYTSPFSRLSGQRSRPHIADLEAGSSRSGTLDIRTADGDTVSISFSAQSALRYSADGGHGARLEQSSQVNVEIAVNGTLDDKEVADISKLIQDLAGAAKAPQPQSSIAAFRFAYQQSDSAQSSYGLAA